MWLIVLSLLVVIIWLYVKLRKLYKHSKGQAELFESLISAAVVTCKKKSDIRTLIENYALFVGHSNKRDADDAIFNLYDLHRLPRPKYAIIDDDLQESIAEELTDLYPSTVRLQRRLIAEDKHWEEAYEG